MYAFSVDSQPGSPLVFPGETFTIGSGPGAELRFEPRLVQPTHAEIRVHLDGTVTVRDLTGRRLTWIDDVPVDEGQLRVGAKLRVGRLTLVLGLDENLGSTAKRRTPFTPPAEDRPASKVGLVPGTVVAGRYRVISHVADGGMGAVYRVEHVELGKPFALKVMRAELSEDEHFAQRFRREALAASRIGHQNIIDISDFGRTEDGRFYFAMELVDGVTIASLVHRHGPLPASRVAAIGLQVARALAAAHAKGIIHRDLKPENVMVVQRPGQADFVKVLDFGIAKVTTPGENPMTMVGTVLGTPQYMSPEQARGEVVDGRSDLYALGLILHEMLTGQATFSGDTPAIVMLKQVTEAPPPLPVHLAAVVPPELTSAVFRMLHKDPRARHATMEEVVTLLERVYAGLTAGTPGLARAATPLASAPVRATGPSDALAAPPALEARPVGGRPRPAMVVALALAALGATAVGGWFAVRPSSAGPATAAEPGPPSPPVAPVTATASAPSPVAPPRTITLELQSAPPGAEVQQDGMTVGTTPFSLDRQPGSTLELSFIAPAGYLDDTRTVVVPDADGTIVVQLKAAPRAAPPPPRRQRPAEPGYGAGEEIKKSPYE